MAAKTLENLYHLQMLKLSKNGKKSEIPKEKQKVTYSVAWQWHLSQLRMKMDYWKIYQRLILAMCLKDFFCQ